MRQEKPLAGGTARGNDQISIRQGTGTSRVQGSQADAPQAAPDVAHHTPDGIDGPRTGNTHRITAARTVRAVCLGCDLVTDNTGAAAGHARSKRHTVRVDYSTTFLFVPAERLSESRGGGPR